MTRANPGTLRTNGGSRDDTPDHHDHRPGWEGHHDQHPRPGVRMSDRPRRHRRLLRSSGVVRTVGDPRLLPPRHPHRRVRGRLVPLDPKERAPTHTRAAAAARTGTASQVAANGAGGNPRPGSIPGPGIHVLFACLSDEHVNRMGNRSRAGRGRKERRWGTRVNTRGWDWSRCAPRWSSRAWKSAYRTRSSGPSYDIGLRCETGVSHPRARSQGHRDLRSWRGWAGEDPPDRYPHA